jgi:hypothetical protein
VVASQNGLALHDDARHYLFTQWLDRDRTPRSRVSAHLAAYFDERAAVTRAPDGAEAHLRETDVPPIGPTSSRLR